MKLTEPERKEIRKTEFLAAVEVRKAIFWPTPNLEIQKSDSSGYSADADLRAS